MRRCSLPSKCYSAKWFSPVSDILFSTMRRKGPSVFRFSREFQVQIHYIGLNQSSECMLQMRTPITLRF